MLGLLLAVVALFGGNVQEESSNDAKSLKASFNVLQKSAKESDWKKYVSRLSPDEQRSLVNNVLLHALLSDDRDLKKKLEEIVRDAESKEKRNRELMLPKILEAVDPLFKTSLEGKLESVQLDGNRASANLVGNPNAPYKVSMHFKKFNGKWKLCSLREYKRTDNQRMNRSADRF